MSVTLRQLQVFLAIAKTENVGAAAAELFMSKSAVSQALSELESRLGAQLFDRSKGRIFLTQAGRTLMPMADEMIKRGRDVSNLFKDKSSSRAFKVGCTRTIGTFMIPDILRSHQDRAGFIPSTVIANTSRITTLLMDFALDFAIVEGPIAEPEIASERWLDDEMIVVAPRNHPLTERPATYADLERMPWILRENGSSSRAFFEAQLRQKLERAEIKAELNSFDAIIRAVLKGLGITYISHRVLNDPFYGRYVDKVVVPDRFMRQLNFAWHKEKYMSSEVQNFKEDCVKYAKFLGRNSDASSGGISFDHSFYSK